MNVQAQPGLSSQIVQVQQQPPPPQRRSRREKYKGTLFGLGVIEVVLGSLSVVLGGVALIIAGTNTGYYYTNQYYYSYSRRQSYYRYYYHYMTYPAQGIWCGICIIVTGILGIRAKKSPTKCTYNANMAMSIIASNFMATLTILSGIAAGITNYRLPGLIAVHSILAILGFAGMVICIVHSAYCCAGVCCRSKQYHGAVAYYPQPLPVQQPQMMQLANGQYMMVQTQPIINQYPTSTVPIASGNVMIPHPQGHVITPVPAAASQQMYTVPNSQPAHVVHPVQQQVPITNPPAQATVQGNKEQQAHSHDTGGNPPGYSTLPTNDGR